LSDPKASRSVVEHAGWLLCAVPLIGLVELVLHVKQTTSDVIPETDWVLARDTVKQDLKPDDLVVFAPFWSDPLGRRTFGDSIATMKREGRSDEQRFARAWEVSTRGAHDEAFAGWKQVKTEHAGAILLTLYENPAFTKVIDDTVDLVSPERLSVFHVDATGAEQPCSFQRGASSGGSTVVPQGLLTPADKFVCQGGHVGVAVLHAVDHHPHLCIYATPLPQNATLRLKFSGITFGTGLFGHSGIQWNDERTPAADKVSLSFSAFDRPIGTHLHKVGVGWVGFELPTNELAGKKGDLVADIASSPHRQFCFEATTR
jgi:hypothetical protein